MLRLNDTSLAEFRLATDKLVKEATDAGMGNVARLFAMEMITGFFDYLDHDVHGVITDSQVQENIEWIAEVMRGKLSREQFLAAMAAHDIIVLSGKA